MSTRFVASEGRQNATLAAFERGLASFWEFGVDWQLGLFLEKSSGNETEQGKMAKLNENPTVYAVTRAERAESVDDIEDEDSYEQFDASEVFDLIRDIQDPEHPLSLEQLNVTEVKNVVVDNEKNRVVIHFTPTVPHCSMSTLIGLSLRVKLLRSLPRRFKVDIYVMPGTHMQEHQVNKQLNDKERVAAALENPNLLQTVNKCIAGLSMA